MPLSVFSLRSILPTTAFIQGTPMIFRISAAEELVAFALANAPQAASAVPVLSLRSTGIPSMLKLHWLKSTFARKSARCIYDI